LRPFDDLRKFLSWAALNNAVNQIGTNDSTGAFGVTQNDDSRAGNVTKGLQNPASRRSK
jgi:hypothetical protein